MVQIRLLGGVTAATDDGRPLDVGPAKCQAVLAALAMSAGSAVPVSRLVEMVWGEGAPRTAEKTLQSYVTRLRKSLGHDAIVRSGSAYVLRVDPDAVDAVRFQRRLRAGDAAGALAEWTGHPLAGLDAEGLAATADALVEQWLGATETELEGRIEHDPPATIAPLTELTAQHPFREQLWALLMTALYRCGRQADALAAYRRARQGFVEELGIEPGARLRELETMILAHDAQLEVAASPARRPGGGRTDPGAMPDPAVAEPAVAEPAAGAPGSPGDDDAARGNLPRRMGRLIGREHDLRALGVALAAAPLVTLVGPGGIGKTRLALAAAHAAEPDLAGGAWLVELAGITASADVPRAVADALGVREGSARSLTESIVAALRPRHALLVLDNCEHVIDGAAHLARAVVDGCPDVRLLVTSREGLGVPGERLFAVEPLDPAGAAAELFAERAGAADRTFDPVAERQAVAEICRRLDGVPLAIELAAARARTIAPAELAARLDDRMLHLAGPGRTGPAHHRTLRATIRWSHDLLSPAERTLFARLSIFAGPFDLAAAEAVSSGDGIDPAAVADLLAGLVDRSMVVVAPGGRGRRFRLLEPIRQFAAEDLARGGGEERMAGRHGRWCRDELARVERMLEGVGEREGVARLRELWPDLRAALERACAVGDRALAHAIVRPLGPEILLRGQSEIGDWVERLLAITPPDDEALIVFGLTWAAQRCTLTQDHDAYERLARLHGEPDHALVHHARAFLYEDYPALAEWAPRAVAALRDLGDDHAAEFFEMDVGAALLNLGRLEEHDAVITALADRYRAQGPPTLLNWALMLLGYSALFQGERTRAERLFDEAVAVSVPEGTHSPNRPIEASALLRRGERARALAVMGGHIDALLASGSLHGTDITAVEFVNMMVRIDRPADAARLLGYLETTNLFDTEVFRELVRDAAARVAADAGPAAERERGHDLDDRGALAFMRAALDEAAG